MNTDTHEFGIEWAEEHSVGVESIDREHMQFIALNDRLFKAIMADRGREVIMGILNELAEFTKTHFAHEERLLSSLGFDTTLLAEHIKEHRDLTKQIQEFIQDVEQSNAIDLEVYDFLRDWTTVHLMKTDSKYAQFLQSHGA